MISIFNSVMSLALKRTHWILFRLMPGNSDITMIDAAIFII